MEEKEVPFIYTVARDLGPLTKTLGVLFLVQPRPLIRITPRHTIAETPSLEGMKVESSSRVQMTTSGVTGWFCLLYWPCAASWALISLGDRCPLPLCVTRRWADIQTFHLEKSPIL